MRHGCTPLPRQGGGFPDGIRPIIEATCDAHFEGLPEVVFFSKKT
ncbi:Uncharacterised protein [Delftia tsuruhatensis]|nr:Uncharacterised protein [Delftia tsuruhatensis]CAC9676786.1 Uncharacterised protein [Delftia tsuruhatensis]